MIYNSFKDCENAIITIKSNGGTATTDEWGNIIQPEDVTVFNGKGIYYELSASEQLSRDQIQKTATGQVVLNPSLVTTAINETMVIYITTDLMTDEKFRMVTNKNPLNKNEAIIIDIAGF